MSGFEIKDGFGLDATVTPGPGALSKYFKSIPDIAVSGINLAETGETDLSNPTLRSQTGALTFGRPVGIGIGGLELDVSAEAAGMLSIFVPEKDGDSLFTPDLFGDDIRVAKNDRYVSMTLLGKLATGVSISPGDWTFGFTGTSFVSLGYYQLFSPTEKLLDAVKETISNFAIPADLDDIERMPAGSIAVAEGTGNLKFSGSANLLAVTNPLAAASLPIFGSLKVTGGAAITVGAAFEFSGDYQVRVHKLSRKTFRLGFYRKHESQFSITADAQVSIAANLDGNDLFAGLMDAISAHPEADLKALQQAGLSENQIQDIQKAIKNAVDRSLAVGASLELSDTRVSDAMFLCEVDLSALQSDGRALLHEALAGNLSGLVSPEENLPRGIVLLKTLVSKTRTLQHSLKVNLLGIYNFSQVSSLILQGKVGWDRTTGEIVVTDQVLASRIGISASNLEADSRKLRRVLAQQFLITAAYSAAARMAGSGPQLSATQSYFDMQSDAKWLDMRNGVLLSAALGLSSTAHAMQKVPERLNRFGPLTVCAEATYNNDAFYSLFFRDGRLRDPGEYTSAARQAIAYLVQPGDRDEARLLLATDDRLFEELERIGNPQSAEFTEALANRGVPPQTVPAMGTDYLNVAFFTEALSSVGQALLEIQRFLAENPNFDPADPDFKKLASSLSKRLAQLAQEATEDFGGPWGFVAMALLQRSDSQKWLLVNAYLAAALENPKPAVIAAPI